MSDGNGSTTRRQWLLDLQASLLALDMHGRVIDRDEPAPSGDTWASVLFRAIKATQLRFDVLLAEWPAGLSRIPRWLSPKEEGSDVHAASGGIALVRQRLATPIGSWQPIAEALAKQPDLLALIDDDWPLPGHASADSLADLTIAEDNQLRVWVPVIHKDSDDGMLVELVVAPNTTRVAGGPDVHHELSVLRPSFVQGLRDGLSGALDRGREVGVAGDVLERWSCLKIVEVNGLPETGDVDDMSAGLPLAVALLEYFLGLPPAPRLVSGPINADGVVEKALAAEQYNKKATAVAQFGAELAVFPPRTDLLMVGRALWGEEWSRAVRRSAARYLEADDHQSARVEDLFAGLVPTVNGKPVRLVRLSLVDDILQRLGNGASVVVVGGGRATSRTISARQAAFTWQGDHGDCPVLELRCADGRLPDRSTLAHLIDLVRLAHDVPEEHRALVLLEDLLPHDGYSDLDEVLPGAARDTATNIIAVCMYAGGGSWVAEHVATAPSIARPEHVEEFCDKLLEANDVDDLRRTTVAIARQTAAGDLSFLTHELLGQSKSFADHWTGGAVAVSAAVNAVRSEASGGSVESLETYRVAQRRLSYANRLTEGLDEAKRADLRIIASCSLLRVSVPEALLQALTRADLLRIDARRDRSNRWWLSNPSACRAVLGMGSLNPQDNYGDRQWKRTSDAQFDALSTFFERAEVMKTREGVALVVATLAAAATLEPRLHFRLIKKLKGALTESLTTGSLGSSLPPVLVAHTLVVGGGEFNEDDRLSLLRTLISSIQAVTWAGLSVQNAAMCLRALLEHRDYFVPTRSPRTQALRDNLGDNLFVAYQDLLSTIQQHLSRRVAQSEPYHAILLLREMGRFYEEVTSKQILPLILAATTSCRRQLQRHYESAVKLTELALQYGSRDQSDAEVLARLANAPGIRDLLECDSPQDAGLLLAHTALNRAIYRDGQDDEDYRRQVGDELKATINNADPQQVTAGLALLAKVDLWFARQVIRVADLKPWVRTTLQSATPWDAAFVLRTVAHVDVRTVTTVLYQPNGLDADAELIEMMADAVINMGDIKGCGYVLSAVAFADNVWGPSGASNASSQLCQALKDFIDEVLSPERRSSVVLALVRALIDAGCPADMLRSLIERCADVVQQEIEDNEKDNAPRLALLLGDHEEIGREFLDLLADRLPDEMLFRRMAAATKVEARGSFHRLARALGRVRDNTLTEKYMDEDWWASAVEDLHRGNALSALKAASAYLATARDAGTDHTAQDLLGDEMDQWAARVRRLNHPGQLGEALDLLRGLSPALARECLSELNRQSRSKSRRSRPITHRPVMGTVDLPNAEVPSPARIAKLQQARVANEDRPMQGVMGIIGRAFIKPTQAVDLLYAVEKIEAGAGTAIGEAMSDLDSWQKRLSMVADIENPAYLGQTLRKLALLNLELPAHVFDRVRRQWEPMVRFLRSPAAVQDLIRGYAVSTAKGEEAARQLIDGLDLHKIGLRLKRGRARDLRYAANLLRGLAVWGAPHHVNVIATSIPTDMTAALNPSDASSLLRAIADTAPTHIQRYLPTACEAVAAHVERIKLVDPESHWLGVGWLLRDLADHGVAVANVVDSAHTLERVAMCTRDEIVRSWIAAALGAWDDLEIEEALTRSAALHSWELVALALCVTEAGAADPKMFNRLGLMNAVEFVSPTWQVRLLQAARSNAALREVVVRDANYFAKLGQWFLDVGIPEGTALIRAVADLQRTQSSDDQPTGSHTV